MPEAEAISSTTVTYNFLCVGQRFLLAKELSLQRVHGDNAYTFRPDKQRSADKYSYCLLDSNQLSIIDLRISSSQKVLEPHVLEVSRPNLRKLSKLSVISGATREVKINARVLSPLPKDMKDFLQLAERGFIVLLYYTSALSIFVKVSNLQ